METKRSIHRAFLLSMIIVAVLSIGTLGFLGIYNSYNGFDKDSKEIREMYIDSQKAIIKNEVQKVVDYIEYMKSLTEKRLKEDIKNRTYEAYNIAMNIYNESKGIKSRSEIEKTVKDALRPIRFNNARGYYFATKLNGIEQLFADRPELEGKNLINMQDTQGKYVIKDMIEIVKNKKEGFYEYTWTKPKVKGRDFPKIAFIKHFEPFDWFIGTGEYLDDVEKDIQKEILERIAKIRFGEDGYIFVVDFDGVTLMNDTQRQLIGKNLWDLTDPNGVKVIQEERKAVENPEGGFINYVWNKPTESKLAPKISSIKGIHEWRWMIGAGVYVDVIDNVIAKKRASLERDVKGQIFKIVFILVALLAFIYIIARHISLRMRKSFDVFSSFFEKSVEESKKIDHKTLHFSEFGNLAFSANRMINHREQTEEALRKSEARFKDLASFLPLSLFETDDQDNVTFANPFAFESTGYTQEDIDKGLHMLQVIHPEDHDKAIKMSMQVMQGLHSDGSEYLVQRKDGSTFHAFINTNPTIKDDKPVGLKGYIFDLTEQKMAEQALRASEEKLARSKKMESLGVLAGGVAHDLNNVLSGIVSYPELLLLDLPKDSKLRKPIETIQETGHRAAAIVQDLITVARGVAIAKEPLNLNVIIEDYLLSPEFKKLEEFHSTVTIKANLDTDLLKISGSDAHLRKVVMNLVSNAAEAIEGSGNVVISTMNCYVDRPIRGYDDVTVGEYVILAVSDGGPGISLDDFERIFEPFYTKKVMGRSGTGLGLAVVWNVVQDLKGYIDVISDENGTTFELYFPITRDEVSDKDLSIPLNDYKGDGETVLVVDDVESQREIACEMLGTLGYKATAVPSGEEAVEFLKEHTVDLILLDMIMDPGINGRETYERIIKIHPNQKAIIASGFAETDDVKEAQKLGAGQYIKKPLTLEKMGIAVRDELKK